MATTTSASKQPPQNKKWSPVEDNTIRELRNKGMTWLEVSNLVAGRSPSACRIRHSKLPEQQIDWSEMKVDKLAQLYNRSKKKMWEGLSRELRVPWRAVEAKHWTVGQVELAKRAGTTPPIQTAVNEEITAAAHQALQARSQLQPRETGALVPYPISNRSQIPPWEPEPRSIASPPRTATADRTHASETIDSPLEYSQQAPRGPLTRLPSIGNLLNGSPCGHSDAGLPPPTQQAYPRLKHVHVTSGSLLADSIGSKRLCEEIDRDSSKRTKREQHEGLTWSVSP